MLKNNMETSDTICLEDFATTPPPANEADRTPLLCVIFFLWCVLQTVSIGQYGCTIFFSSCPPPTLSRDPLEGIFLMIHHSHPSARAGTLDWPGSWRASTVSTRSVSSGGLKGAPRPQAGPRGPTFYISTSLYAMFATTATLFWWPNFNRFIDFCIYIVYLYIDWFSHALICVLIIKVRGLQLS